MIAMKYINTGEATIAAIRDFNNMRTILSNTPDEMKEAYERMMAPRSPSMSGMPSAPSPQAGDDRLAAHLDKLDILRERYRSAAEYMAWFEPAWNSLTEKEQFILQEFFFDRHGKTEAVGVIGERFCVERAQVYRKKDKALSHLTLLLYGKSA